VSNDEFVHLRDLWIEHPTQKEIVFRQLVDRGVVCGDWFLRLHIPRYAARILELRAEGYDITRVPCPYPYHTHRKTLASYRLTP
jgi:hypothetical protein